MALNSEAEALRMNFFYRYTAAFLRVIFVVSFGSVLTSLVISSIVDRVNRYSCPGLGPYWQGKRGLWNSLYVQDVVFIGPPRGGRIADISSWNCVGAGGILSAARGSACTGTVPPAHVATEA